MIGFFYDMSFFFGLISNSNFYFLLDDSRTIISIGKTMV